MGLSDYKFGDIYLGEKRRFFSDVQGLDSPSTPPTDCMAELDELFLLCKAAEIKNRAVGRDEFPVRLKETVFRVSPLVSLTETTYVLRRFPAVVPEISSLRINQKLVDLMLRPALTGLVVFSGAFGQGKTTTASAMTDARLRKFGGVAVTIEDPPEMPLEGNHGQGECFQTWVVKGGFGDKCRQAARWAPSIIYLGEIRDSEAALEALRASINGRLVIATTHADSVPSTIARIYQMASAASQGDDAASMLADGLTGVFHQQLVPDGDDSRRPQMTFLWLRNGQFSNGVRANIRNKKFTHLETEVQHQANRLAINRTIEEEGVA